MRLDKGVGDLWERWDQGWRGKSHPGDFGVMRETRGAKMPEELLITSVAAKK